MMRAGMVAAAFMALAAGATANADELCGFIDEVSAAGAEAVKGRVLEENVTIANFTIYETDLRAPLDGFQTCVIEQRTKDNGALSRLLVCRHGDGETRSPLPEERFASIGQRLEECAGSGGAEGGDRRIWMIRDGGLKRIDLVSNARGAHLALVYRERREAGRADAGEEGAGGRSSRDGGICEAVESMDLAAAFGNTLAFGEFQARSGRACTVPIEGAQGEGLIVQLGGAGVYDMKAAMGKSQNVPFSEVADLGQEAFIVNQADLNVRVDDARTLSVGISAIFMDPGLLPEPSTIEAGLTEVARAVIAAR